MSKDSYYEIRTKNAYYARVRARIPPGHIVIIIDGPNGTEKILKQDIVKMREYGK